MIPISMPPQHVSYNVKHAEWISPGQWQNFTLPVTEAFWLLPVHLRPYSTTNGARMERSSEMFPSPEVFVFGGKDEGSYDLPGPYF